MGMEKSRTEQVKSANLPIYCIDLPISFASVGIACSTCGVHSSPQLILTQFRYFPVAEKTTPGQKEMPL